MENNVCEILRKYAAMKNLPEGSRNIFTLTPNMTIEWNPAGDDPSIILLFEQNCDFRIRLHFEEKVIKMDLEKKDGPALQPEFEAAKQFLMYIMNICVEMSEFEDLDFGQVSACINILDSWLEPGTVSM